MTCSPFPVAARSRRDAAARRTTSRGSQIAISPSRRRPVQARLQARPPRQRRRCTAAGIPAPCPDRGRDETQRDGSGTGWDGNGTSRDGVASMVQRQTAVGSHRKLNAALVVTYHWQSNRDRFRLAPGGPVTRDLAAQHSCDGRCRRRPGRHDGGQSHHQRRAYQNKHLCERRPAAAAARPRAARQGLRECPLLPRPPWARR